MRRVVLGLGAVVLAVVLVWVLVGRDGVPGPGRSTIEVDTPALREQKAEIGIEPCVPGTSGGASELPVLTLPCLGGGPDVDLSTLSGPLVINLWASNCAPCRREMPALQEFHEKYGDRVPILGIDAVDTQPESALGLAEITGATYPQLADPNGDIYEQDSLTVRLGLPTFLFVDEDGTVTQAQGGVDSLDEVTAMVEDQLGVTL